MLGKKKVYIEAQRLFRKQKHGMDVVALELLQRLRNIPTEFALTVIVKEDIDHCLKDGNSLSVQTLQPGFYPFWEQFTLPKFLAKSDPGLLHCTGNTAPIWGKSPLLITIHDLIFLEENYLFKKDGGSLYQRFGNFYRSLVVPIVAKRAKYIITVSEFQRQLIMRKLKVPAEKICVVYNGADERFFKRADNNVLNTILKKYSIDGFPYFFFLANTEPRKNTEGVIKAFSTFCKEYPQYNHHLVIKGLTDEILKKKIIVCNAEDFASRIHWVGYIDYADLPGLYQGAAMLWFPSFTEGFGLPIVEAMAVGTPVITSNTSVMPEIAGDAALYVDPYQPEELAHQADKILSNQLLREDLIAKGKKNALRFNWADSVNNLLGIYNKLVRPDN